MAGFAIIGWFGWGKVLSQICKMSLEELVRWKSNHSIMLRIRLASVEYCAEVVLLETDP